MTKKITNPKADKKSKLTTAKSLYGGEPALDVQDSSNVGQETVQESPVIEQETVQEAPEIKQEKPVVEMRTDDPVRQPLVRIKPVRDHNTFIGDRWYFLQKGKVITVPQNVKDILYKAGLLDTI